MAATSRREMLLHLLRIDRAVGPRRHRLDPVAEQRGGRRIGAVRRIRHQHDRALLAARRERRLDRHHAAQFAMRARLRRQRDRRHAGQFAQPARQLGDQRERARHGRLRLQRMDVAEAGQPRHLLVQPRIVLHGARAERKHSGVDAVVHARQPHVVAHRLRLGEAGQAGLLALQAAEPRLEFLRLVDVDAGHLGAADLEDQRFLDAQRPVAGERLRRGRQRRDRFGRTALTVHASTSFSAAT